MIFFFAWIENHRFCALAWGLHQRRHRRRAVNPGWARAIDPPQTGGEESSPPAPGTGRSTGGHQQAADLGWGYG